MAMNTFLNFLMTFMIGNKYYGALYLILSIQNTLLQLLRGSAATNITVFCTSLYLIEFRFYKYYAALPLSLWNNGILLKWY
jgi:hypothetical protein